MTIINQNTWSKPAVLCLLLTAIWGTALPRAAAQTLYGGLVGNVRDASEGVVAGATVTITNANTNQSRQAVTNEVGSYSIPNSRPLRHDWALVHLHFDARCRLTFRNASQY